MDVEGVEVAVGTADVHTTFGNSRGRDEWRAFESPAFLPGRRVEGKHGPRVIFIIKPPGSDIDDTIDNGGRGPNEFTGLHAPQFADLSTGVRSRHRSGAGGIRPVHRHVTRQVR